MFRNKNLKSLLVTAFFAITCASVSLPVAAEDNDDDLVVTIMCWFICPPNSSDK